MERRGLRRNRNIKFRRILATCSIYLIGYVLYNGVFVQGLPNPYTQYVPIITVGGLLGYAIYNNWLLSGLRNDAWEWGYQYGFYTMVCFGS